VVEDEIDLRDLLDVLWRERRLIAGIFLVAVLAAGAIGFLMPSIYRASCIIALGNFGDPVYTTQADASEIMLSDAFILDLAERLNISRSRTPDALRESINVEPVKGSDRLLRVSIETEDPEEGTNIIEEMSLLFVDRCNQSYSKQRGILMEQLAVTEELLNSVEKSVNQTHESLATIDGASGVSPVEKSLLLSYKLEYLQSAESQRLSLFNRQMDLQKQLELMKYVEVVEAPVVPTEPVKPRRL